MNIPKQLQPLERVSLVKYSSNLINSEVVHGDKGDLLIIGAEPNLPNKFNLSSDYGFYSQLAAIAILDKLYQ